MRPDLRRLIDRHDVESVDREFRLPAESYEQVRRNVEAGDTCGVGAVVHDDAGRVALVKNRWSDGWVLPGGSLEPGESFEEAVHREVREETGLAVEIAAVLRVERQHFHSEDDPAADPITWYYVVHLARATDTELGDDLGVDDGEIRDAGWFETVPEGTLGREFVVEALEGIR